jgi:hypothetical protein
MQMYKYATLDVHIKSASPAEVQLQPVHTFQQCLERSFPQARRPAPHLSCVIGFSQRPPLPAQTDMEKLGPPNGGLNQGFQMDGAGYKYICHIISM